MNSRKRHRTVTRYVRGFLPVPLPARCVDRRVVLNITFMEQLGGPEYTECVTLLAAVLAAVESVAVFVRVFVSLGLGGWL